ncbi:MAG: cytoskeleton protein RodZ [Cellvibrionaceae bacterium]|jgi:cytoskeleton protein RodZ
MANNNNIARDDKAAGEPPGKLLADIRKKTKLGEREVADALKISVSRLKSIENSDFSVFPSETHIRGHLRNYSRFLKCDELQILSAYDGNKLGVISSDLPNAGEEALLANNKQKGWWVVYIVLVLLALVWSLSYRMFGPQGQSFSPSSISYGSEPAVIEVPNASLNSQEVLQGLPQAVLEEAQPLEDSNNELEFVSDGFSPSSSVADSTSPASQISSEGSNKINGVDQGSVVRQLTASELVRSIREKVDNASIVPAIEGDTLEFTFVNLSWVQVTDATGAVLFKGTNKPGAELDLNGKAPFKVVIGNVAGASLVYNGESVSLDVPTGKNTLRITLGG